MKMSYIERAALFDPLLCNYIRHCRSGSILDRAVNETEFKRIEDGYYEIVSQFNNDIRRKSILPIIKSINVKNEPQNGKCLYDENGKYQKPTVIVTFSDGTTEKATTSEDDTFSLEQGISICYTKKLLSLLTTDDGSKVYNKMLHKAMKLYKSQQEEVLKKAEIDRLAKERSERLAIKRAKRKAKLEAKKREQEISIQAEAYARALKMVNQDENK